MDMIDYLSAPNLKDIVVNSISELLKPYQHEYVASKHALMGYLKSLIAESNNNFDVMAINPGGIDTEFGKIPKY